MEVGYLIDHRGKLREVRYAAIGGYAVVGGDIGLAPLSQMRAASKALREAKKKTGINALSGDLAAGTLKPFGNVISGDEVRWPGGVVAYKIDSGLANQQRVLDAMRHWEARTSIRFKQQTNEDAWVRFITSRYGDTCQSMIGRQGGEQLTDLGPDCNTASVIHEIGHVVGLDHEQNRADRDQHVQIHFDNIIGNNAFNFYQSGPGFDDAGAYDFASIMHYGAYDFAVDQTRPTITALDGSTNFGFATGLSPGDIDAVETIIHPGTQPGWEVHICREGTNTRKADFRVGTSESDARDWFTFNIQTAQSLDIPLPADLRYASRVYLYVNNPGDDPHQMNMCLRYAGRPKQWYSFDDDEDHYASAAQGDTGDCKC